MARKNHFTHTTCDMDFDVVPAQLMGGCRRLSEVWDHASWEYVICVSVCIYNYGFVL